MNIQERVADTLLQHKTKITINGVDFNVAPPTLATLVKVGGLASQLGDKKDGIESLNSIKDVEIIADILCLLVLGARKANVEHWWQFSRKRHKRSLKKWIMHNATPAQLCLIVADIISCLQINDFFLFTTSLKGMIMTNPTRGVEIKTTAYGQ